MSDKEGDLRVGSPPGGVGSKGTRRQPVGDQKPAQSLVPATNCRDAKRVVEGGALDLQDAWELCCCRYALVLGH